MCTGSGDARLSRRGENAGHDALHSVIQIRVIENNVRGLPAEFQRNLLDPLRRQLINVLACPVAAGECDLRDVTMRN